MVSVGQELLGSVAGQCIAACVLGWFVLALNKTNMAVSMHVCVCEGRGCCLAWPC